MPKRGRDKGDEEVDIEPSEQEKRQKAEIVSTEEIYAVVYQIKYLLYQNNQE